MAKFLLMFHAGASPEEPSPAVMDRWMAWFGELGEAVVEMGAPFGAVATIASDGTPSEGGGPDPATRSASDAAKSTSSSTRALSTRSSCPSPPPACLDPTTSRRSATC